MTPQLRIPILDLSIIVGYIIAILCIGVLSTKNQKMTGQVFFLAGRSLPWGIVGASLFASNISTIHLVGLTASGYNEGLVWGNFEWMAAFTLILLALVFAPFYFRSGVSTLPEFLERRYSPASRSFLAFMAIVAALFIHIGSRGIPAVFRRQCNHIDSDRRNRSFHLHRFRRTESCRHHGDLQHSFSALRSMRYCYLRRASAAATWHSYLGPIQVGGEARTTEYASDRQRGWPELVRGISRLSDSWCLVLVH
jgi:Sodium:solute symporter family